MPKRTKTALLVGASGLVGSHCLRLLLESPAYSRVRVIARKPVGVQHGKLNQHVFNFDVLPDVPGLFEVEDVFCCLGTTIARAGSQAGFAKVDRDYPRMIAERAVNYGARQFLLVSSVGADARSRNFYLRTKGEAEQSVRALPFHAVHLFRPSMLLGDRAEFRWKEKMAEPFMRALSLALLGGWSKYRAINGSTVARAMVNAANVDSAGVHVYEFSELQKLAFHKPATAIV